MTWSEKKIISWPEDTGARSIRFSADYIKKIKEELGEAKLPGLPLAVFLLRDPRTTGIKLDTVNAPQSLVDVFRTSFNLGEQALESIIDFDVKPFPFKSVVSTTVQSAAEMVTLLKHTFPFQFANENEAKPGDALDEEYSRGMAAYRIPVPERRGISSQPLQLLVHGCPGTGKSFLLRTWAKELARTFTVVFHPETTYGDFVGVYRPLSIFRDGDDAKYLDEAGNVREHGEPYMTYEFVPGPLLSAYCTAWLNPNESVAMIVEEISRGNASLVFGDTLQLLDRSEGALDGFEAGISTYAITARAEITAFLVRNRVPLAEHGLMRFPPNLHIWATMNRSDQNARQLDAAFLRRWEKRHLSYKTPSVYGATKVQVPGGDLQWDDLRGRINAVLVGLVPEDKFVGPYFLPEKRLSDSMAVAEDLLGYLWNDVLKSRAKDLFTESTLTDALEAWISGNRNPLKI